MPGLVMATSYTWTGSTSTNWATSTNWSPNGIPGATDNVTIVTGSNQVYLDMTRSVTNYTMSSGTFNLQTYTFNVTGTFQSNVGTISNGILNIRNSSSAIFGGATAINTITKVSANSVLLSGGKFSDSLFIVKKGTSNDNGYGGNKFSGYLSITDSSTGNLVLAYVLPDTCLGKVALVSISTGRIYLAHNSTGNVFNNDIYFNNGNIYCNYYGTTTFNCNLYFSNISGTNVYFGTGTGTSTVSNGHSLYINGSFTSGQLNFRGLSVLDTTTSINLSLGTTAFALFQSGSKFHCPVTVSAGIINVAGCRFFQDASFTQTGANNTVSNGGSYFVKNATFNNSGTGNIAASLSYPDTFNMPVRYISSRSMSVNYAVFNDSVYFISNNTTTASDRFSLASSGNCYFNGVAVIDNTYSGFAVGASGGSSVFNSGSSLYISPSSTGTITFKKILYDSNVPVNFNVPNVYKLVLGANNRFDSKFTFYGKSITVAGSTFNDTTSITRYGNSGDTWEGGNDFYGVTSIKDSSSNNHNFYMATTGSDHFYSDLHLSQYGTNVVIYPAYNFYTYVDGNLTISCTTNGVQFGAVAGTLMFVGSANSTINFTSGTPIIKRLTIGKTAGNLLLSSKVNISTSLVLSQGNIISTATYYLCMLDNATVSSASDNSFVDGPVKKIGNDAFVFPLGNDSIEKYLPLHISAPSSTTEEFVARYYYHGTPDSTSLDTIKLSNCEYWELSHLVGSSIVDVTLSWNTTSCMVDDEVNLYVMRFSSGGWNNAGQSGLTSLSGKGSLTSSTSFSIGTTATQFAFGGKIPINYALLQKDYDGGFYYVHPVSHRLYFKYDEEYMPGTLSFKVYDYERVDMCSNLSALPKSYGDNRFVLEAGSCVGTLPSSGSSIAPVAGQTYYLEVTDEKKEKFYLKFRYQ